VNRDAKRRVARRELGANEVVADRDDYCRVRFR